MAKIKLSYQTDQELHTVIKLLHPVIKSYKVAKVQQGKYKKAYIETNGDICDTLKRR